MKKKINKNNIMPFKHYFYIISTIIIVLLISWYVISWYQAIQKERLNKSYLIASNTISLELKNINEAISVLTETPSNYYVFITYTGSEKEYNLEKKLKKIIDNNNIADKFYYLDITEIINKNNLISYLNKSFDTDLISSIPCILYYEDDKLIDVIQKNTDIFDANELQKHIDNTNKIE